MADYTLKHTGSEIDAAIDTVKAGKMPNPHALTINGTSYDGTKAVSLTISGDDSSNRSYILPQTTLVAEDMQLGGIWFLDGFVLIVGETYTVSYNGKEYECVCKRYDYDGETTIFYLGNGNGYGAEDTGEPFRINYYADGAGEPMIRVTDGATDITVAIFRHAPAQYLPDTTGITDVRICAWNGSKWVPITIDVLKSLLGIA